MRELKFRAWCRTIRRMITVKSIDWGYDANDVLWPYDIEGEYLDTEEDVCYRSGTNFEMAVYSEEESDVVLMLYTGLKDSKGVEIYEGDVVKQHNVRGYDTLAVGAIEWDTYRGMWKHSRYSQECLTGENMTVIGNIYENPELLEKDK